METETEDFADEATIALEDRIVSLSDRSSETGLAADIRAYEKMTTDLGAMTTLRKGISETIRKIDDERQQKQETFGLLRRLPAAVRSRMAARLALLRVQRPERAAPEPMDVLKEELFFLSSRRQKLKAKLKVLEARILAFSPTTMKEAKLLLNFVTQLKSGGKRYEAHNLSAIMDDCVQRLATTGTANSNARLRRA